MEEEIELELEQDILSMMFEEEENEELQIEGSDTVQTGGTNDYKKLKNKPSIEGVELIDDKTFEELGLKELTNFELENLLK